jgi:hypothetical protein
MPPPARKEELIGFEMRRRDPRGDRVPRLLDDLELHRSLGLFLHDDRAGSNVTALNHVVDVKPDQITPAQLAVDGEVEQREFPGPTTQLKSDSDGPDLFQF